MPMRAPPRPPPTHHHQTPPRRDAGYWPSTTIHALGCALLAGRSAHGYVFLHLGPPLATKLRPLGSMATFSAILAAAAMCVIQALAGGKK